MKIVLLLVAVYALIINQALKQVDSKQVIQQAKKEKKGQRSGFSPYIDASVSPVTPVVMESGLRQFSPDEKNMQPRYLLQPAVILPENAKPQNTLYPINYPYPLNLEKKRS